MKKLIILLLIFSGLEGAATPYATKKQMESQLDSIGHFFDTSYAMKTFKEQELKWSLQNEVEWAKSSVRFHPNISMKEFQMIVRKFIYSFKDYHVGVSFYSTEEATLPFEIRGVKGRYFFTKVGGRLPMRVGDELLTFNGKPVGQVVKELKALQRGANSATDQALAEMALTHRTGRGGWVVPKLQERDVSFSYQSRMTRKKQMIKTQWSWVPELIKNGSYATLGSTVSDIGSRDSFLPPLGKVIWNAGPNSPFQAYLFTTPSGKRVGFLRIHSYQPKNYEKADCCLLVDEFQKLIKLLEVKSDLLIVDQMNNQGGEAHFLAALLSHLSSQPLKMPLNRVQLTQSLVIESYVRMVQFGSIRSDLEAQTALKKELFNGLPVTLETVKKKRDEAYFSIGEWEQGKTLTDPYPLIGFDVITPSSRARYTKPILFLINELCFSCGDVAPAILQDNGRCQIMGKQTAGAGGHVGQYKYPNPFGIEEITYTYSVIQRKDQSKVENRGVIPDIPYEWTEADIRDGFIDFKAYLYTIIDKLTSR